MLGDVVTGGLSRQLGRVDDVVIMVLAHHNSGITFGRHLQSKESGATILANIKGLDESPGWSVQCCFLQQQVHCCVVVVKVLTTVNKGVDEVLLEVGVGCIAVVVCDNTMVTKNI